MRTSGIPGDSADSGDDELRDERASREVLSHRDIWEGLVFSLAEDQVRLHEHAVPVTRQYLVHPGAVGIVALRGTDGYEEILLAKQYRHPVGMCLWEIPAGLLDVEGEEPLAAAQRELAEEADLRADSWDVLVDYFTSPGASEEAIRIYLARKCSSTEVPFPRVEEEADLEYMWLDLDTAVTAVLSGRLHNPSACMGILSAWTARARRWNDIRNIDSSWQR